jgi:hypothetical protein
MQEENETRQTELLENLGSELWLLKKPIFLI